MRLLFSLLSLLLLTSVTAFHLGIHSDPASRSTHTPGSSIKGHLDFSDEHGDAAYPDPLPHHSVPLSGQASWYTNENGSPMEDFTQSLTLGPHGPTLLEDQTLQDRNALLNRERPPERTVHSRGALAKGKFTVTSKKISEYTVADFLQKGRVTPLALRFSTVVHRADSPEFLRDPRGFAIKFYTQQGNFDLPGLNFPVFWVRDGAKFPDLVRALKPNPVNGRQEWWRILDYFNNLSEVMHILTFVLDDEGIPKDYRHLNGFGVNTYLLINPHRKTCPVHYTRFFFESQQGSVGAVDEEVYKQHFSYASSDLFQNIFVGNFPKWTLKMQVLCTDTALETLGFDPEDPTKVWPTEKAPFIEVGELELNENQHSLLLENEQIAFHVNRMVPGIGASNDKLMQSRLFAYSDSQRYRATGNHMMLPINRPRCPFFDQHYGGIMNFKHPAAETEVNYFPSAMYSGTNYKVGTYKNLQIPNVTVSEFLYRNPGDLNAIYGMPIRTRGPYTDPKVEAKAGASIKDKLLLDDYTQGGERYRSWDKERQYRFGQRIACTLSTIRIDNEIRKNWFERWRKIDQELGERVENLTQMLLKEKDTSTRHKFKRDKKMDRKLIKEFCWHFAITGGNID